MTRLTLYLLMATSIGTMTLHTFMLKLIIRLQQQRLREGW